MNWPGMSRRGPRCPRPWVWRKIASPTPRAACAAIRRSWVPSSARVPPVLQGASWPAFSAGASGRRELAAGSSIRTSAHGPGHRQSRLALAFGRGLVASVDDFGLLGEPPSHPELLDWLARRLVADGWSLKALHRLIVTSSTYRQSSTAIRHRGSIRRTACWAGPTSSGWRPNRSATPCSALAASSTKPGAAPADGQKPRILL